jgi:hypothetical protein
LRTLRFRTFGLSFLVALVAGSARAQSFDDVWQIMTQEAGADSPGCRGCHIVAQPPRGLIWGDTEDEVLQSLQTPDKVSGIAVVDGGNRGSKMSFRVECGSMPFFGRRWHEGPDDPDHPDEYFQFQLEKLRAWLAQFDDPTADPTTCP